MSIILSLQGCMASGKTTAAKYVESNSNNVYVSYENPSPLLKEIKEHGWDKNAFDGFVEIQRLFIKAEIERWEECKRNKIALMDLGSDEIEFITLFYPKSIGFDWDMERHLKDELKELRGNKYNGVLYLDASDEMLINNMEKDTTRKRGFFNHYINELNSYKREWFANRENPVTEFLNVDDMTKEQVGRYVEDWIAGFSSSAKNR